MGLAGGSQISLSNKHLVPSPYASARTSRRVRGPFGASILLERSSEARGRGYPDPRRLAITVSMMP
jgi:hypothetical protein